MKSGKRFWKGWSRLDIGLLAVALLLCVLAGGVAASTFLLFRSPTPVAEELTPTASPASGDEPDETSNVTLSLLPDTGSPGTTVAVYGEGWPAQSRIIIYLVPVEPPRYAVNSVVAGADGRFEVDIIVPSDPRWLDESPVPVLAELADGGLTAQALLNISSPIAGGIATATPAPGAPVTPVGATVTPVLPRPTPTLIPPPSDVAQLTATTNLNVRGGPGTQYEILGVLLYGQQAEIIGRNSDATWWQIKFPGASQGMGWVAAAFATAMNIANIPIVHAPPPPPPPPPTPTPAPNVVITDWRGDYFNNINLNGSPVLVRNDLTISFDWGFTSPDTRLPVDQFSARWTRVAHFRAGVYRFYTRVDDGVRLWVDGALLINQWHDTSPATYQADIYLSEGPHHLRMEYYDRYLGAVAILTWERIDQFPDWKAEYYNNPNLQGAPVLLRNEPSLNYQWGSGSPDPVVPVDHFSARWQRQVYFEQGEYILRARADDGLRLWLDNILVIDRWQDGPSGWIELARNIPGGQRQMRIEYYERSGDALIEVAWGRKGQPDEPPLAVISSASEGIVGQPLIFDGHRSRRGDNGIARYEWDFGDGGRATGPWVSHTYNAPGTYGVRLTVIDTKGLEDRVRVDIRIVTDPQDSTPPIAIINALTTVKVGSPITLDASSSLSLHPIAHYEWSFGDGTGATGRTVSHIYQQPGHYTVRLTVITQNGLRSSAYLPVRVDSNLIPLAPVARIEAPGVAEVAEQISFDAGSSTTYSRIVSYAWDFGDGHTANGLTVPHTYEAPGLYNVILTLTDEFDQRNSANKQIQIVTAPEPETTPIPVINAPAQARVGEAVIFDGSDSISAGPIDEGAFVWDFGDGAAATGPTVSHIYGTPGNYQVSLTITDQNERSNTASAAIHIEPRPEPPQPQIRGPERGIVGQVMTFDASDSQVNSPIVKLEWELGDGSTANELIITHAYDEPGNYVISLRLTDENGLEGTALKQVQIEPATSPNPPVAVIEAPTSAEVGQNIIFDGSASQSDHNLASFTWDFGDGSQAAGAIVQHKYSQAGLYEATLTVVDDQGSSASSTTEIEILSPATPEMPPVASIAAPAGATVGEMITFDGSNSMVAGPVVSYTWDFGDGTQGSGITVTHTYASPDTYPVTLTVSNETGADITGVQIVILPAQPTPTTTPAPPSLTSTPTVTMDPTLSPTAEPTTATATAVVTEAVTPSSTWTATPSVIETATPVPTETPTPMTATPAVSETATPGLTRTPTVVVTNTPAVTPTSPLTLTVTPASTQTLLAVISGPTQAQVGQAVTLSGGFSQSSSPVAAYSWSLGDGNSALGLRIAHTYTVTGLYTVTLTITDTAGLSESARQAIQINPSAP